MAVAGMLLATALALYPMAVASRLYPMILLAVPALLFFALSLLATDWTLVGPGLALILVEYAISLSIHGGGIDPSSVAFAVAAVLLLEIIDLYMVQSDAKDARDTVIAHVRNIILFVGAGGAVAGASLVAARLAEGGPVGAFALAAVCGGGAVLAAVGLMTAVLGREA
jgi:hypothetical protein